MTEFYKIAEHTLTNIADAMRMWTGKENKITPDEMPQEVDSVFNAGADIGYNTGYDHGKRDGSEEGARDEYERFWDSFQNEVLPGNCDFRYAGAGWNKTTLKPNHDIKPKSATSMFRRCLYDGDLVELAEQQRIEIDFSECEAMTYAFYECSVARLGVIDCTAAAALTGTFGYLNGCHTIDLIKVHSENTFSATFRCPALVEVRFEGVIGQNGFDIHWSTGLSKASLESIVNAASTSASITITLPRGAVQREFETSAGANDGNTSQEWKDLVATRPTVTFALS